MSIADTCRHRAGADRSRRTRCRDCGGQDRHARDAGHRSRGGRRHQPPGAPKRRRRSGPGQRRARARTLLAPEAVSLLKALLLPLASVVTPNVAEAAALSGVEVTSLDAAREAARRIAEFGPAAVVSKEAIFMGQQAIDLLFTTGSSPSSPLHAPTSASYTARGAHSRRRSPPGSHSDDDVATAVERAKRYVTGAIEHSFSIGHGARILNHFWVQPSPR